MHERTFYFGIHPSQKLELKTGKSHIFILKFPASQVESTLQIQRKWEMDLEISSKKMGENSTHSDFFPLFDWLILSLCL